jgi:hypothetical protein
VHTHQIYVLRARDRAQDIRQALFEFSEVLDVFVTGRPDCLVVVSQGRPRLGEWLRALRARGFELPARRHASKRASDGEDGGRPVQDRRLPALNGGEPRPAHSRRDSPRRAAAVSSGAVG